MQVSRKCFLPHIANQNFVTPLLSSFPNLKTFLMTTVANTLTQGNIITGVTAVQRVPKGSCSGWETLTSRCSTNRAPNRNSSSQLTIASSANFRIGIPQILPIFS